MDGNAGRAGGVVAATCPIPDRTPAAIRVAAASARTGTVEACCRIMNTLLSHRAHENVDPGAPVAVPSGFARTSYVSHLLTIFTYSRPGCPAMSLSLPCQAAAIDDQQLARDVGGVVGGQEGDGGRHLGRVA